MHGLNVATLNLTGDLQPDLRDRYLGPAGSAVYLIRPDQHVAARWQTFDPEGVAQALATATGHGS